jgi:predicted transcriptional regulator
VGVPLPDLNRLAKAMSQPTRWKMLKELTVGEARTIRELAGVGGCSYENARKHLAVLQQAGLVVQGRGRLYQIPKQYLPTPGQPVADFGHCLLRLDAA